jgi:acetylornithine deacetylase/succinyl-diaminopimelate desuccinylase-like protein
MQEAAQMLANQLESAGCDEVRIFPTNGHAVVFGQKIIDAQLPTVLVYGHYDVQPPDPLDLWDSPPFDPVIKKTDIQKKSY